ncbi:MAG: pyruvate kinase [Promethearchaeota archaeon]
MNLSDKKPRVLREKIVKSKIVATLGPATFSEEKLIELRDHGLDVFRINMSHASEEGKEVIELFGRIRKVAPDMAILCDIQGPKIRIGKIYGEVLLSHGDFFTIFENPIIGDKTKASISYPGFFKDVQIGTSIFINDGLVHLKVIRKDEDKRAVITEVISGGPISTRKGVNIPEGHLSTKNPTEKDFRDLRLLAKLNPEYIAISFVSKADEVRQIRSFLQNLGASKIGLISKIERPVALTNFDEILDVSNGIMVARGDLGVEIPKEEVPIRQKEMILKCNKQGKPVIVATQMLESMTHNPVPTRAEVNDVFNAVYDRSDAVMLSGETSVGEFPIIAVTTMDTIINKAEEYIPPLDPVEIDSGEPEMYEAEGHAIFELARVFQRVNFRGKIITFTRGGKSPRKIAKYRPEFPILALTHQKRTARQLNLVWGVKPFYLPKMIIGDWEAEKIMQYGIRHLVEYGVLEKNEHVICSVPSRISPHRCALIGMYYVDDILKGVEVNSHKYSPDWNTEEK